MDALAPIEPVELLARLRLGLRLTRPATQRLLRSLERLSSDTVGCLVMQAQLRAVLARRDWLLISVSADPATVRTTGVSIGIIETSPQKPRLTPMQQWQRKHLRIR